MMRGTWIAVAVALAAALAVAALGLEAAQRDRVALVAAFGAEHLSRVRFAAREVEAELEEVWRDLGLVARLVETASSGRERDLGALLAAVRQYERVVVYDAEARRTLSVDDPEAPSRASPDPFAGALDETAARAIATRAPAVSPLLEGGGASARRVFALPRAASGGAVALLVDLGDAFARLVVASPHASERLVVLGPDGAPVPMTRPDTSGAIARGGLPAGAAGLLAAMRSGESGTMSLGRRDAGALGLGQADAVAAFAPIRDVAVGGHWAVAVIGPTEILRSKERLIELQLASLGVTAALAIALLSAYLVVNARRAAAASERLRAAEQLVRAEKLATVGVLAAGIAHEIGTPLAVVRGRAERIAEKLGAEHPQTRDAATVLEEIDRIARIIRELLDYARPSAARTVPVALDEVAARVVQLLAVEARRRGVALEVALPPDLPPVAADPDQLEQVLLNLVLNGVHACAPGGRVAVRAEHRGGSLAIEIEDDGAGIPAELRDRVFDPFFTTKKRGIGTGLGLTVAARLVRGHGGELELDSEVGRGTRARIAWPVAAREREVSHG